MVYTRITKVNRKIVGVNPTANIIGRRRRVHLYSKVSRNIKGVNDMTNLEKQAQQAFNNFFGDALEAAAKALGEDNQKEEQS